MYKNGHKANNVFDMIFNLTCCYLTCFLLLENDELLIFTGFYLNTSLFKFKPPGVILHVKGTSFCKTVGKKKPSHLLFYLVFSYLPFHGRIARLFFF